MKASDLPNRILANKSYLCVGLDPDLEKLPAHLPKNAEGVLEFCIHIIEATLPFAVSYKVNTAFFEAMGAPGWQVMELVFKHLKNKEIFAIADAKRADIGNTSAQYAKAFFEQMDADAITLSPYMGHDSIQPFLEYEDKTAILLALTSNPGHADFEMLMLENGKRLYEQVMETSQTWQRKGELMFVVGATRSSEIAQIRKACPDAFLLVPGVGAQGGSLKEISRHGFNRNIGLLVNASRSIIFADGSKDFAMKAAEEAFKVQQEMEGYLG